MLKKKLNYTALIIIFILSESFLAITAYFEFYTLRQLGGQIIFSGIGVYVIYNKTAIADWLEAGGNLFQKNRPWACSPDSMFGLKGLEFFVLISGWLFILFGILAVFGIGPQVKIRSLFS